MLDRSVNSRATAEGVTAGQTETGMLPHAPLAMPKQILEHPVRLRSRLLALIAPARGTGRAEPDGFGH